MCFDVFFPSPEHLAERNVYSPTVFDLDSRNKHHFVGNLIANSAQISQKIFSICFHEKITQNQKQLEKNVKF